MNLIWQVMGVLMSLHKSLNPKDPVTNYVLWVSSYSITIFFEIFQKGERMGKKIV
jgi:hypothetical protein